MLKIYGSRLCPDCVQCLADLDRQGIAYEYHDFADDLAALKTFLAIRDSDPQFEEIRENGSIGIPCLVHGDGSVHLTW